VSLTCGDYDVWPDQNTFVEWNDANRKVVRSLIRKRSNLVILFNTRSCSLFDDDVG
jgi:hypothetical protein